MTSNLHLKLNESPSLNSFKTDTDQSRNLSQGELIEECKNSLNELIKASKWSTKPSEAQSSPAIPSRIKYSDKTTKTSIGSFPPTSSASLNKSFNCDDKTRFNNYDNLIQIKNECSNDSNKEYFSTKLAAPLASTSELDETKIESHRNSVNRSKFNTGKLNKLFNKEKYFKKNKVKKKKTKNLIKFIYLTSFSFLIIKHFCYNPKAFFVKCQFNI